MAVAISSTGKKRKAKSAAETADIDKEEMAELEAESETGALGEDDLD